MDFKIIVLNLALLAYVAFVICIFVGGGFITNILFTENTKCVGLDTMDKLNLAKLTIVIFWIVFIPLFLLPIAIGFKTKIF